MTPRLIDTLAGHYRRALDRPAVGRSTVGVEVEFPVLPLSGRCPREEELAWLLEELAWAWGLERLASDESGRALKVRWPSGDVLTFEFCYGSLELSMAPCDSLVTLSRRMDRNLAAVRGFLGQLGFGLGFCGINPFPWARSLSPVKTQYYALVSEYLRMFASERGAAYAGFNSYIHSCQTHLDASAATTVDLINVLNGLGWARALLFANSPFLPGESRDCGTLCVRDCLWDVSAFARDGCNVGPYPRFFNDIEDFLGFEASKYMFRARRGDDHVFFPPMPMVEVLSGRKVKAWSVRPEGGLSERVIEGSPDDLGSHRSYNDVALTQHGTLEIRGDCQQPQGSMTAPAALYLGLSANLAEAGALVRSLYRDAGTPAQRRREAVSTGLPPRRDAIHTHLLTRILDIAWAGLIARGLDEEAFLMPLYERLERKTNPALQWLSAVRCGFSPGSIVLRAAGI